MAPILVAVAVLLGSGLLALAASRAPRLATAIGALGAVAAAVIGLAPTVAALGGGPPLALARGWAVPAGTLAFGLDPLSAFFLAPLLVLSAIAAVYGRAYLLAYAARKPLGPPAFFFNALVASMILVVVARDGVLFLVGWEAMTLTSYLLVAFDHEDPAVKRAGWVYLIAAHAGVACLLAMFLLLARGGSLEFAALGASGRALPTVVFLLALLGFGVKAGLVPLHVWLPEAHAAAPSHVSALMSGVLIKMGLYGILRATTFLPLAGWWAPALIVLGLVGGLLGISLALYQRDLKRVLAYSSIENVGLILLGLGVGLWGVSRGDGRLAALGLAGGLLHVWNHALMKGLMFLGAGSVLHGAGGKDLEKLGGLMKRMPATGALLTVGAVAIAGLPPLNGFAGEWLMYLGLVEGGLARGGVAALFAVGLLALVGALALACFVRLVGVALLGQPRGEAAAHAHESPPSMLGPMALLAAGCAVVAIAPGRVLALFAAVVGQLGGPAAAAALPQVAAGTRPIGLGAAAVWAGALVFAAALAVLARRRAAADTWGCGYRAPSARMQYTAGSFAELFARRLLPRPLRARVASRPPEAIFPRAGDFSSESADPFTRGVYEPFLARWADRFQRLRWLQQGILHVYLLYILVALLLALGWASARAWIGA